MDWSKIKELFFYGVFGVLTTVLNLFVFFVFRDKLRLPLITANTIAWIIAVVFAFVTNKLFVFNSKSWEPAVWVKELVEFFSSRIFTFIVETVLLFLSVKVCHLNEKLCKVAITVLVIILNYVLSKLWVFKKKTNG